MNKGGCVYMPHTAKTKPDIDRQGRRRRGGRKRPLKRSSAKWEQQDELEREYVAAAKVS